ncbi:MAG: hypothetical protein AAF465_01460 [Pseudomonadota bacterium]
MYEPCGGFCTHTQRDDNDRPNGIKHSEANLSTADAFAAAEQRRSVALFLLAISVLVIANIRHGLLTLGEGLDRQKTRALDHTLLNGALITLAIVLAIVAYRQSSILFYVFTGLCSATAYTNLRYAWRPKVTRGDRIQSHLASMIGAGIASHTAFFVFGANRFLSDALSGHWQLVPWVAPAVVGTIIINRISRRYVRKPRRSTSHA